MFYADKYFRAIFEIKYHRDYEEAKKILGNSLREKESQLLYLLRQANVDAIDEILVRLKKEFVKNNKRYLNSNTFL
jgi:hypothetical protein